jgi:hypothetical protein
MASRSTAPRKAVFTGAITAPSLTSANQITTNSGQLGSIRLTRSPRTTPRAASAPASVSDRRSMSP